MSSAPKVLHKASASRQTSTPRKAPAFFAKEEMPTKMVILDPDLIQEIIEERQKQGIDRHDEVWEGVYVVPPLANLEHQALTTALSAIFFNVITLEERGIVYGGANVSDRRTGWKENFRAPDVVVVMNETKALDCRTHLLNGPDFLVEVQSPGDQTEEKMPFYSQIGVRELLIIHRDSRELRLFRHDGQRLAQVPASHFQRGKWLVSTVLPLAFRRKAQRGDPRTELQRTDGVPGNWTV
jgi:Uma2 family endonuclease